MLEAGRSVATAGWKDGGLVSSSVSVEDSVLTLFGRPDDWVIDDVVGGPVGAVAGWLVGAGVGWAKLAIRSPLA